MPIQLIFNFFRQLKLMFLSLAVGTALMGCQSDTQQIVPPFKISEISGHILSQEDLKGKVSIINFWATSCTTCVKEMPEMIETYKKYKSDQLEFIAVAMSYDPPMYVVNFAKTRNLPFHVAMDSDGSVAKAFGKIQLTPTTLVINKSGKIIKRYVGEPDWKEFHQLLENSLAEST